jgi:hypothetical protein
MSQREGEQQKSGSSSAPQEQQSSKHPAILPFPPQFQHSTFQRVVTMLSL